MTDPVFNIDRFRSEGHLLIDYIAEYLKRCEQKEIDVLSPIEADDSFKYWNDELYSPGLSTLALFDQMIRKSTHLHHPGYIGHQVSVAQPLSILSDVVAGLLDNGMAVYEMGQVSVAMEKAVCSYLSKFIGWDENRSNGFFTSGGTLANLTALLTARQHFSNGKYWNHGHENIHYAVMVSGEAHYCIDRAVKIMGLGKQGIITVPVNGHHQIDIQTIEQSYREAIEDGKQVFAFVANLGSTSVGAYDSIAPIAAFCKRNNIWLHGDGAHGGLVFLSEKYKHLVQAIDQVDSLTLDFHKLLQTSILCTCLLYKDEKHSYKTFSQGAEYLFAKQDEEWYQLGKRTFECTKPMMVLKAYTLIHQLGIQRLVHDIDLRYDLAKEFAILIQDDPLFELAVTPESNIVCFRLRPDHLSLEECNQLNSSIRWKLIESGKYYIVQTVIQDTVFLRTALMNPATTIDLLTTLLKDIRLLYEST